MKKLHHTNITIGLVAKVLTACHKTFQAGVIDVQILNSKMEPILNVKRVKILNSNKFIVTDNYGENVADLFIKGMGNHARQMPEKLLAVRKLFVKHFLWHFEQTYLNKRGIKC